MSAPHRDLPAGSQRWADEMDAKTDKIAWLESVVRRLAQNAGVDPSNPDGLVNPQSGAPSSASPVVQKLNSFDDVNAYNVADGQVLSWSQSGQAWTPLTPSYGAQYWPVDDNFVESGTEGLGIGQGETSLTSGAESFVAFRPAGWMLIKTRTDPADGGSGGFERLNMYNGHIDMIARDASGNETGILVNYVAGGVQVSGTHMILPSAATANRPDASSHYGSVLFDTTLKTVVVSDGVNWNPLGGGGGNDEFAVPSGTAFSLSGTDPQAEGHNKGASGQYGFMSTSDREVYLAATDGANGDANVYMSSAGVNIEADAPGTSSDYDMYSEALVAKDGITLKSTVGSGTGAGGIVKVLANWFIVPVQGHTLVSAAGKQGAMILDPGLNKPLWSDGTNWRDATGTVVS